MYIRKTKTSKLKLGLNIFSQDLKRSKLFSLELMFLDDLY